MDNQPTTPTSPTSPTPPVTAPTPSVQEPAAVPNSTVAPTAGKSGGNKKKWLLILLVVVILVVAVGAIGGYFYLGQSSKSGDASAVPTPAGQVACTQEAKLCDDGVTYVSRQGLDCEFEACPVVTPLESPVPSTATPSLSPAATTTVAPTP